MMEVIQNIEIRNKYHAGFPRESKDIMEIVIHGTGGGESAAGILKWMADGERAEQYKKGIALFHDLIDLDGTIINVIDHDKWVYHSGSGAHDKRTIGIELLNPAKDNKGPYSENQYTSLAGYIVSLIKKYPTIKIITSHNYNQTVYSNKPKSCPGSLFKWTTIVDSLQLYGYGCLYGSEHIYNIKAVGA